MRDLIQDLRIAVRQLGRSRAFTFTVILTLALGIGLNAAIFTMVDSILLKPLGYHDAERIYSLNTRFLDENRSIARLGGGDYIDVRDRVGSLETAAYYQSYKDGLQIGQRALYLEMAYVSPEFGQVMGVQPLIGRLFRADGEEALVSSAFARENFGSAQSALGQVLRSQEKPKVIVGVLPDGFSFPGKSQVWIEVPAAPGNLNRTSYNQRAIGKVKPGVTAAALNAEMATLSKQLGAAYPEDKSKAVEAVSLQDQIVGKIRPTLRLLMGSVGVILLIVCANITHLQLVRATRLRREVTIRTALGASRWALTRRAALEVMLLAVGGCVAGVLVAVPALRLLVRMAPADVPRLTDVHLNLDVILFSFVVSLVTMGLTALLPLWRSWSVDPASAMKQDAARGMETRQSGRLRHGLIVGEVALTLMLSVAAMLLVRQLIAESKRDLGFVADKLVMMDTHASSVATDEHASLEARIAAGALRLSDLSAMLDALRAVPGVRSVAAIAGAPMGPGGSDVSYAVRGVSEFKAGATLPDANLFPMTPGYFQTMGLHMISGRDITEADRAGSDHVLVISEAAARQSFAGVDPVGKAIMCGYDEEHPTWWRIVGVVSDVRQDSPAAEPYPTFYVPVAQHTGAATDMQVMVRTQSDAGAMSVALERMMRERFPAVAARATAMRENVGESQRAEQFRTMLFGSFAGVSILLAVTGMYGVTAYTVAQRRFEFALRFALGAQRGQVMGSVLQRALTVAALGVVAGIGLSAALMRVMSSMLGQQPHLDAVAYGVAAGGVLMIALVATLQPAWQAARVEPMQVLRDE